MATLEELQDALINADKAGDKNAARILADEIVRVRSIPAPATEPAAESDQSRAVREDLAATSNKFFQGKPNSARTIDSFMRGAADTASFGMADEIAAAADRNNPFNPANYGSLNDAANAISNLNPINAGINQLDDIIAPDEETQSRLRQERAFQAHREDIDSGAMTAGRISGALLGAGGLMKARAPFMAALPAEATLGAKVAQGAKAGALYSGAYGAGSGEGIKDRLVEGGKQAAIGGFLGAAVPTVASGLYAGGKPVIDAVKARINPGAFADQKIAERLRAAGVTTDQAANKMTRNPGMNLADSGGEPTRNLLRTASNIPGKAQHTIATRLALRQMQQGDRIKRAVRETLAEPDGYLSAVDDINTTARDLARPLFREAYEIPIPFTESLERELATPAGRRALAEAERLAANEQIPFRHTFRNEINGTERLVPDTRGWEYIRQALDDMIEAQRDPLRGNRLTNEGRILVGLQNRIFREVRRANPVYDSALNVWSGAHRVENALEAGREALKQSPEATRRAIATMSEAERSAFRTGLAVAIRDAIGPANVTHNGLLKFFGSRDQLASLRAAFASEEQFRAFQQAMFAEARKRQTYNAVKGNSTTARQLMDAMESGGLKDRVNIAGDALRQGVIPATINWIGSRLKMLGGFTPEVADQVAQRLLTADPARVRSITNELARIERQQISSDQRSQAIQRLIAPVLSGQIQELRQRSVR